MGSCTLYFMGVPEALFRTHALEEFLGTPFIGEQVGTRRSLALEINFRAFHRAKMSSQDTQ